MNNIKKINNSGFGVFVVMIGLVVLAIVLVVGYVVLKRPSKSNLAPLYSPKASAMPVATQEPTVAPVSQSDDMTTIEKEINQTQINSTESEFVNLNSSASGL